jgi:hypothetical protein
MVTCGADDRTRIHVNSPAAYQRVKTERNALTAKERAHDSKRVAWDARRTAVRGDMSRVCAYMLIETLDNTTYKWW